MDRILQALDDSFDQEEELLLVVSNPIKCSILHYMDGSIVLWLGVILSARKDFLLYHNNPNKDKMVDYNTAYQFIFDDEYRIRFGDDKDKKEIRLEELLDTCIGSLESKKINSDVLDPSIKRFRKEIALDSEDPELIKLYCS